jgi:acyl-CoA thioester hydrolase
MKNPDHDDRVLDYTVAYADTDAAGVIYHGRYLELAERSRNSMIRGAGYPYGMLLREFDIIFVVHKVNATYYASGFLEDQLSLRTRLTLCATSRSIWVTDVRRDNTLLASISVEMVGIRGSTRALCRHPEALLAAFAPLVEPA